MIEGGKLPRVGSSHFVDVSTHFEERGWINEPSLQIVW